MSTMKQQRSPKGFAPPTIEWPGPSAIYGAAGGPTSLISEDELAGFEYRCMRDPRSKLDKQPERRLALAVLNDGLREALAAHKLRNGYRRLAALALAWIDEDDHAWPYSFINLCAALDLSAGALRDQVHTALAKGRRVNKTVYHHASGTSMLKLAPTTRGRGYDSREPKTVIGRANFAQRWK